MKHLAKARVLLTSPGPYAVRFGASVPLRAFATAADLDAISAHTASMPGLAFDAIVDRPGVPRRTDRVVWGLVVEEGEPCCLLELERRFGAALAAARSAGAPLDALSRPSPALHVVGRQLGPGQSLSLVRGVPWSGPEDPVLVGDRREALLTLVRRARLDPELATLAASGSESAMVAADALEERGHVDLAIAVRRLGADDPDVADQIPPLRVHGVHGIGPFTAHATFGHRGDREVPAATPLGHPLPWARDDALDSVIIAFSGASPGWVLAHGDAALPSRLASVRTMLRAQFLPGTDDDPFEEIVHHHRALLEADAWRCGSPLSANEVAGLEAGLSLTFPERLRWFLRTLTGGWTDHRRGATWLGDLPWRFEGHGGWPVPLAQLPVDGVSRAVRAVLHPSGPERMVVPFEREPAAMAPSTVLSQLLRVGLRGHPLERRVRTHDLLVTAGHFASTIVRVVEYGVTVSVSRHGPLDRWLVDGFDDMIDPGMPL